MNQENSAPDQMISIIIPVYNGSLTIGHCLESVFGSSYRNFECIVVDDHSNDNTIEIAKNFGAKIIASERQYGAAHARNRGAEAASGNILLFIDADVTVYPDSLEKVIGVFEANPEISALFGSYDDKPERSNFLSQYKNLFHHYIHQTSRENASTFWTGCGAVKKEAFFHVGKFNAKCRMMEDIELGYKLRAKNHKIRLVKNLVVKHFKHYSFTNLLKSDFFDRSIPWTILMLGNKQFTSDLNLKPSHKLSAIVTFLLLVSCFLTAKSLWFIIGVPLLLAFFLIMNYDFYTFFLRKRGVLFTLRVVPLHLLYYLYSSLGFLVGSYKYHFRKETY